MELFAFMLGFSLFMFLMVFIPPNKILAFFVILVVSVATETLADNWCNRETLLDLITVLVCLLGWCVFGLGKKLKKGVELWNKLNH